MLSESVKNNANLTLTNRFFRRLLSVFGWTLITNTPPASKYVVIGAPHTSLWDYPLFISALFSIDNNCRWLAHSHLFSPFLSPITRRCGGFQLEINPRTSFVEKFTNEFNKNESLVFCLAPEGSSSYVPRWRTGFYYIALTSGVPIVLGFIDYKNKTLGLGDYFMPTGDIAKDLHFIQNFYRDITAKNPDRAGLIKL